MLAFRAQTASPEEVEQLIDLHIARIDEEIQHLTHQLELLRVTRKRWISVTGGRSRIPTPDTAEAP